MTEARSFIDGFEQTLVGRAMLAMIRLIGPKRTLERLNRQFRTGNNYSVTRLVPRGATEYDLWVNDVSLPGWYEGVLTRGMEKAGAADVRVALVERTAEGDTTFRVSWRPS